MNRKIISALLLLIIVALAGMPDASALPGYLNTFNTTYPFAVGTRIDTCTLCHVNPSGGGSLNMYGIDFSNNTNNFTAIESLDSDGDGFTNIEEIITLTFPGNSSDYSFYTTPTATVTLTATPAATGTRTPTPAVTGTQTISGASTVTKTATVAGTAEVTPTVTPTSTPAPAPKSTPIAPDFEILFAIAAVLVAILITRR